MLQRVPPSLLSLTSTSLIFLIQRRVSCHKQKKDTPTHAYQNNHKMYEFFCSFLLLHVPILAASLLYHNLTIPLPECLMKESVQGDGQRWIHFFRQEPSAPIRPDLRALWPLEPIEANDLMRRSYEGERGVGEEMGERRGVKSKHPNRHRKVCLKFKTQQLFLRRWKSFDINIYAFQNASQSTGVGLFNVLTSSAEQNEQKSGTRGRTGTGKCLSFATALARF